MLTTHECTTGSTPVKAGESVNLAAALDLARAGFPIFPCKPDKSPFLGDGFKGAVTDIAQIERWWAQWPNALIGLPTGTASGLWVLDGDMSPAKGVDGFEELRRLEAEHGALPIDVCAVTPRGGTHVYFRMPVDVEIRNSQSKIARGLDVRASGGYVIVASRLPDGRAYCWVNEGLGEADLPDAPEWLVEMAIRKGPPSQPMPGQDLQPNERANGPTPARPVTGDPLADRKRAYALAALDREVADLVRAPEGTRNGQLNIAAHSLGIYVGAGALQEGEVRSALTQAAATCGLTPYETRKTLASGLERGKEKPASFPPEWEAEQADLERLRALNTLDDGTRFDPETGEVIEPSLPPLKMVPFTDCFGETPPARCWIIKDWIPAEGEVTSLYGDGGVGKTLLAQLTQAKLALGYNWFGHSAMPVRSLGFYCEDSVNELWRRRHRILKHLFGGREPSDHEMRMLAGAMECSRVGEDSLLMTFDRQGKGQVTTFQRQIIERARDERTTVVILDNASTMFPGDAVNASMVRQFVDVACGGIASAIHGAVVLCAHPSKSGMSTGSGDAGSVQWNAAVRSRLYLRRPQVDGVEDRSSLILSRMKGNYADVRSDVEIPLRWTDDGVLDLNAPEGADRRPPATEVFLRCLDERVRQGRFVSDKARGSTYAPKIFSGMPAGFSCGYSKDQFEMAMQSLFLSNEIELAWIHGVDRHARQMILRPGQCMELRKSPSRRISDAADIDALHGDWSEDDV